MPGNRLYREPNQWESGDIISKIKVDNLEAAVLSIAEEVVAAAGSNEGEEITLLERLNLITNNFKTDMYEMIAQVEDSNVAKYAHQVNTYFIYNNELYKSTSNINIGSQITPNTNCKKIILTNNLATEETMTLAEYEALSEEKKMDGTIRFITDVNAYPDAGGAQF